MPQHGNMCRAVDQMLLSDKFAPATTLWKTAVQQSQPAYEQLLVGRVQCVIGPGNSGETADDCWGMSHVEDGEYLLAIKIDRWQPLLFVLLLFPLLAACGARSARRPAPAATVATVPATPAEEQTVQPLALVDRELLALAATAADCDHSTGVEFRCEAVATAPHLQVTTDGSGFARWQLHFAEAAQSLSGKLTGNETLLLQLRQRGTLAPNLYLVERSGRRVAVALKAHGFVADAAQTEQTIAIPLREIRDDEGAWPDFSAINAIQLVFEWAAMSGELTLLSLQFASVWQETILPNAEAQTLAAGLVLPTGFRATAMATGLREVTQLAFTVAGAKADDDGAALLWASTQSGRIWRYRDVDRDGSYEERQLYATGFAEVVGLLPDPIDGAVWVGGRGTLIRTIDENGDGVADRRETRLAGLPWGRHQNNGLAWNPDPDPFTGEAGAHWIYFGLGSTEDLEIGGEWNAQVLRFPRTGQGIEDLESVSRGNRNPYMVLWAPVPVDPSEPTGATAWQLFASENGPDFNDAPDEVNHIRWQQHYGFPAQFGAVTDADGDGPAGEPYSGPIYSVVAHASASGLAYVTNPAWPTDYRTLYVSLFGQVFSEEVVGHTVERIALQAVESAGETSYRGVPSVFVAGLDRPLPMTTTPAGSLVVGDYATGVVYRIDYIGEPGAGEGR